MVTTSTTTGFRGGKIGCIAVDVKYHVASRVADDRVGVSGGVVEEVNDGSGGGGGGFGLRAGDCVERDQHGGVDGAGIVEKSADNLLDAVDVSGGKKSRDTGFVGILDFRLVDWASPSMWCVLCTGRSGMLKFVERLGNISGHG